LQPIAIEERAEDLGRLNVLRLLVVFPEHGRRQLGIEGAEG
jgi:hypothetical protein